MAASWDHEGIAELFRSDPGLGVELLRGPPGVELPFFADARVETGALAQLNPAERWVRRAATGASTEALFE
jgi:hypothetical protein